MYGKLMDPECLLALVFANGFEFAKLHSCDKFP